MSKRNNLLKGTHPDIISANVTTLKNAGYDHTRAVRCALCHANMSKPHLSRVAKTVAKKAPITMKVSPKTLRMA